jgi:hypothetical protein
MFKQLPLTGLEEGEFTQITPEIRDLATKIDQYGPTRNWSVPEKVSHFLMRKLSRRKRGEGNPAEFRNRTASEIIADKDRRYSNGCSDDGIVFLALCRALNQPALYIETVREEALEKSEEPWRDGHVFADVFVNGIWMPCNPKTLTSLVNYNLHGERYIPFARGIDFSHLYIFNPQTEEYFSNPERNQIHTKKQHDARDIATKYFGGWRNR